MAKDAFTAIAKAEASFASRGDKSSTNTKELSVWASAAITPTKDMKWYKSLGQGMGETLLFSQENMAYTLSDRGTYLAMKEKRPDLVLVVGGDNLGEKRMPACWILSACCRWTRRAPGRGYDLAMRITT